MSIALVTAESTSLSFSCRVRLLSVDFVACSSLFVISYSFHSFVRCVKNFSTLMESLDCIPRSVVFAIWSRLPKSVRLLKSMTMPRWSEFVRS